ncbi:flagellar biosynthesis protein FlhF [Neobacillus sp. K501]
MKTEKIIADSMPLALKKVRQQLGENAIIVNTRAIKTGGLFGLFAKQKYEVTAYAIDNGPAPSKSKTIVDRKDPIEMPVKEKEPVIKNTENTGNSPSVFHKNPQKLYNFYSQQTEMTEKQNAPEQKNETVLKNILEQKQERTNKSSGAESQMLDELQHMRKMMMNFMMSENAGGNLPSGIVKWVNQLKKQGVDDEVIAHLTNTLLQKYESLNDLSEEMLKNEIKTLVEEIIVKRVPASNAVAEQTRIINVIGPTGVGKTTTIAKLATEQVLKQKRRVAMITTDVYRIAAVEQLKTYAGILNVPIEVVRSTDELEKAVARLKNYDLIYMDTTGRNYKEMQNRESIFEYLNYPLQSDNYLVLSLTTKFEDMQVLLNSFLKSPVKKLILTKFDETTSYGSILNIAFNYPYQLAYIANGQSVPEDIAPIDAASLARYLLGEEN